MITPPPKLHFMGGVWQDRAVVAYFDTKTTFEASS